MHSRNGLRTCDHRRAGEIGRADFGRRVYTLALMKPLMMAALLLAAAPAFGGYQFFFNPPTSPPEGGATIQITRNSFELDFRCCEKPEILFGGVAASSVTVISDRMVEAVTPPHAKGFVDVVVRMGGKTFTTDSRFAFTPKLETIILPIAVEMRGGYGTRWTTDIVIYNDSAEEVTLDREVCFFIGSIFPCERVRTINPGATMHIPARTSYPESSMAILEPPELLASRLHFSLRVRDAEREGPGEGVEIPVVRARDLRVGRISLPNIPTSRRYRSTLRVYHGFYDAVFDVIARDETGRTLMRRHFDPGPRPTDAGGWDMTAIQGIIDDPDIRDVSNVRIDIESATSSPFWAMVSLTDNTTQQVLIYTPQ